MPKMLPTMMQVMNRYKNCEDFVKSVTLFTSRAGSSCLNTRYDGRKVAKIAGAPMLRSTGIRLPISAQVNPNRASTAIITEISPGSLPETKNIDTTPTKSTYTGSGRIPIRNSMSFHQPCGQKPAVAVWSWLKGGTGRDTGTECSLSSGLV